MVLETVASVITLWDCVLKINNIRLTVKDAPGECQKYMDGLRGIACTQTVLENTVDSYPRIRTLVVEDDGEKRPFVDFINAKVKRVRNDASDLISRFDMISPSKSAKPRIWRNWFRHGRRVCGFILSKDQISGMVRDVEHAQKQLYMALTLASINASESWRSNADLLLATIRAEIAEHGKTLEKIKENGRLGRAVLEVDHQAIQPPTENAPPVPASAEQPSRPSGTSETFKGALNAITKPFKKKPRRKPPVNPTKPDGSTKQATGGAGDDTYEVDNESDDDREPPTLEPAIATILSQDAGGTSDSIYEVDNELDDDREPPTLEPTIATVPSQDVGAPGSNTVGYGPILKDGKYFQAPLNSEEYSAAAGPSGNAGSDLDHPPAAIRVDEVVESMSEEEWDHVQYRPLEELVSGFVTSSPITPYPSDAETVTDEPPVVAIDIRLPTYVLVTQSVRLRSCKDREAAKLNVCVDWASVERVFCIVEPCSAERKHKCKHLTLELEDGPGFAESPPCRIELDNLHFLDEGAGHVSSSGKSTSPSWVLPSNRQCPSFRGPCHHTKFFDAQHNRARCALPVKLSARAVPPEPPTQVDSDVHKYACQLLRDVTLDEAARIPSEIELHTLVRFLDLAHKHIRGMPEKALEQARRWVSLSRPPSSFDDDDDALLWLWVMWKLQMVEEFKALSSVVQRQARTPISRRWQDGPGSRFGIKLPDTVLISLDQKRLDALSRVRSMMSAETERQWQAYLRMVAASASMPLNAQILASSLSFGYLTLEGERWLPEDGPACSTPAFSGVSFDGVSAAVRSMIDLRDWIVGLEALLEQRVPPRLTLFNMLMPRMHEFSHRAIVQYPESSRVRLTALVEQIENEEWGVNLTATRS